MQMKYKILEQCEDAKIASIELASVKTDIKDKALAEIANAIKRDKGKILAANKKDLDNAGKAT